MTLVENEPMNIWLKGLIILSIFIVIIIGILMIHQMQEKIDYRCSKVNNTGIIKFWDADINCSSIENIKNRVVSNNEGVKE